MAKVVYHVTMSLDGFIAGPDHAMDWVFRSSGPDPEPNPEATAVIGSTGAALAGRNGYEVGRKQGQHPSARKLFGGAWSGPIFVLTHQPPTDEDDPDITFLTGDIRAAVGKALEAAAGKDLLVLGGTVAEQCVGAGLLDEILIHVAPVLLGDGIRLFERSGPVVDLDPIGVSRSGRITNLRFSVVR
jgi:dihydrofolate reductase